MRSCICLRSTGLGRHNLRGGIDADHIGFFESYRRAPVNYLREDGTLLRQSIFPAIAPFTRHNVELGAYIEDRWTPRDGFLIEPGLRFRLGRDYPSAVVFAASGRRLVARADWPAETKVSAGIGVYYEHTQLEYLTRSLAGIRYDTYFAAGRSNTTGPPLKTMFTYTGRGTERGVCPQLERGSRQKLPGTSYVNANYIHKAVEHEFAYANLERAGSALG